MEKISPNPWPKPFRFLVLLKLSHFLIRIASPSASLGSAFHLGEYSCSSPWRGHSQPCWRRTELSHARPSSGWGTERGTEQGEEKRAGEAGQTGPSGQGAGQTGPSSGQGSGSGQSASFFRQSFGQSRAFSRHWFGQSRTFYRHWLRQSRYSSDLNQRPPSCRAGRIRRNFHNLQS